jgi:hypothetical protein
MESLPVGDNYDDRCLVLGVCRYAYACLFELGCITYSPVPPVGMELPVGIVIGVSRTPPRKARGGFLLPSQT